MSPYLAKILSVIRLIGLELSQTLQLRHIRPALSLQFGYGSLICHLQSGQFPEYVVPGLRRLVLEVWGCLLPLL